jgi:hemoglobin-like flavoprotein
MSRNERMFMLSPSARPCIEASVPVLRTQGVAITQRFDASLFTAPPERARSGAS